MCWLLIETSSHNLLYTTCSGSLETNCNRKVFGKSQVNVLQSCELESSPLVASVDHGQGDLEEEGSLRCERGCHTRNK